jgi:hypothetical protein
MRALTLVAKLALAQEPEPTLEQQAFAHLEAASFEDCARDFLQVYNTEQQHPRPDMLLWHAAECAEAAGSIGPSVQARTALLERHPDSEFARDTLLRLADSYAAVAYYERAAERYEQFAAHYRDDKHTPDALQNAYLFRVGLSQRDAARRDLVDYERLYEQKDLEKAASFFAARQQLLDSWKDKRKHAVEYLAKYDGEVDLDFLIVAEAVIAQIDWRRSCPEPLLLDSCISVVRERVHPSRAALPVPTLTKPNQRYRPPKRCGSPSQAIVTVHRRNTKLSADAQARFQKILKLARAPRKIAIPEHEVARQRDFAAARAMAMVHVADAKFEDYLRLELPPNLDFYIDGDLRGDYGDPVDPVAERKYQAQLKIHNDSMRQLLEFVERKRALAKELWDLYGKVEFAMTPHWALVAAVRYAWVARAFHDKLTNAKVPGSLRSEVEVQSYCKALADEAAHTSALPAWLYCVERSTEFQIVNEFSYSCEDELAQLGVPPTTELFGQPVYAGGGIQPVGVLSEEQGKRLVGE